MRLSPALAGSLLAAVVYAGDASPTDVSSCLNQANVPNSLPDSPSYSQLAEPYNLRLAYKPLVIVLPTTNQHVQDAVKCAAQSSLKVQAKSGGHSYASFSSGGQDGAMVIDLEPLQAITLDSDQILEVGGGVRLGNLAQGAFDQGKRAVSHGTCPGVGIGGHSTHGGYGHTSRNWGLALDHIVGADVVLADGSFIERISTENEPDLFWAIRGAAESFAIVTKFYLRTQEAPDSVTYFSFQWGGAVYASKDAFTGTFMHLQDVATNASVVDHRISFGTYLDGGSYSTSGTFFGTVDDFNANIRPEFVRGVIQPSDVVVESLDWISYLKLMSNRNSIVEPLSGYNEHDTFFAKSITVPETDGVTADAIGAFFDHISSPNRPTSFFSIIDLYGGPGSKINSPDADAAYNRHDALWTFQNYGYGGSISTPEALQWINELNNVIPNAQPGTAFGAYLNYVDPSLATATAQQLYYGADILGRLKTLKGKYDASNLFWNPQAIEA